MLASIIADAADLDLGAQPAVPTAGQSGSDGEALRYLRDPLLRAAEDLDRHSRNLSDRRLVVGHLVAQLQPHPCGPGTLLVTDIGVRAGHRDGMAGPLLVAALRDEADRFGVADVVALATHPAATAYLRDLGFGRPSARSSARPQLLRLGG